LLGFMMLLNGGVSLSFSGHISVLAKSCGYSAAAAAAILSFFSLVTALSKLLSGGITDRLGTKVSTAGLILIFIAGCVCVIPMNGVSLVPCYASALFMGFGASVFNMGPALWAADLAPKAGYPKTVRWLQLFYNLGGIIFTVVPGFIAERSGEYKSSYILFAFMMGASLFILLWTYRYSENT
ncbi:MAG: MFS transporter, partial [Firmicutes bacterium]|nr:MFS transporter [Bacillota bacterium]